MTKDKKKARVIADRLILTIYPTTKGGYVSTLDTKYPSKLTWEERAEQLGQAWLSSLEAIGDTEKAKEVYEKVMGITKRKRQQEAVEELLERQDASPILPKDGRTWMEVIEAEIEGKDETVSHGIRRRYNLAVCLAQAITIKSEETDGRITKEGVRHSLARVLGADSSQVEQVSLLLALDAHWDRADELRAALESKDDDMVKEVAAVEQAEGME